MLGLQHNLAQKKKERKEKQKEKRKESNVDNVGSTKMMMIRNRCALRRIPTTLLSLRTAAYQATPSRRDATMMTLLPGQILGFPPVCGGAWERGTPGALQEGMVAPVGITASVLAIRQGFLPTPKKPRPQCSNALHQTRHHDFAITTAISP
jgi:hypothetical protein